jgi:diguanylate cyclase (GGDEF)-like protein
MTRDRMPTRSVALRAGRRWTSISLILLVLLGGAGGSLALIASVERIQQRFAGRLMDQNADSISLAVSDEASRYDETLTDLAAAMGAQSSLTADDFTTVTSGLNRDRLPGVSGVAFVVSAGGGEIPVVQARWRDRGVAGLRFSPVGSPPEHMFVVLTRSLDNTVPNPGRDLSQAAEPLEALQLARSSGEVAASRTYVLLRDRGLPAGQRQHSFTLTAPVYGGIGTADAGQFRGWVLLGMRGGDFIDEVLARHARDTMRIGLFDLSATEPIAVAVTSNRPMAGAADLERARTVTIGQRTWRLRMQPTDQLLNVIDRNLPRVAGWGGLVLTLLMVLLVNGRRLALGKVERTTRALRLDIEQRKAIEARLRRSENELRRVALHDPLTGLANRTLFHERLEHAMATHSRAPGNLAVLFIDLDGFKRINDELGHSAGDAVLVQTAQRLSQCARDSDTVARFGGDEFAILTELLAAPEHIEIVAERVVRAMQDPFDINGHPAVISCSVGVALHVPGQLADDLMHSADEAMYAAKAAGKDRYAFAGG